MKLEGSEHVTSDLSKSNRVSPHFAPLQRSPFLLPVTSEKPPLLHFLTLLPLSWPPPADPSPSVCLCVWTFWSSFSRAPSLSIILFLGGSTAARPGSRYLLLPQNTESSLTRAELSPESYTGHKHSCPNPSYRFHLQNLFTCSCLLPWLMVPPSSLPKGEGSSIVDPPFILPIYFSCICPFPPSLLPSSWPNSCLSFAISS